MIYSKKYGNGLRLVIKSVKHVYSVVCGINVLVGSSNETKKTNGISHYIEHMMFKGTKTRTAFDINNQMERLGAEVNAFTSKEQTCYYVRAIRENFESALDILCDIFFNATFSDDEAKREKGVILEELAMIADSPDSLCENLLAQSYYGDRNFGYEIIGTKDNVQNFTKKDIISHINEYYTADNIVVTIVGNIDVQKAVELAEKYFVPFVLSAKPNRNKIVTIDRQTRDLFLTKDTEQTHLGLRFPSATYNDDDLYAKILGDSILGDGMSSRLFRKIREELGLAYSVYGYSSNYLSHGVSDVYSATNSKNRDKVFSAIIEEIKKIKTDGVEDEEFLKVKEQYKSALLFSQENMLTQMRLYSKFMLLYDEEYDVEKRLQKVNSITKENIQDALNKYYDFNKMATATVGTLKTPLK